MEYFKKIVHKIGQHFLLRNIVFAVCGVIVLVFVINILLSIFTRHGQHNEVPDFVGMTIDAAAPLTDDASLEFVIVDSLFVPGTAPATILDQSPEAGSSVKSGRKVFLTINSVSPRSDVIPYVTGLSLRQAKNILEGKGFQIKRLIYRSDMATNNVIGESYDGREIVRGSSVKTTLGSGITLTVGRSASAPLPPTPKVVGLTLREAKSRLWEIGLNVGKISRDADVTDQNEDQAKVYKQSPAQQVRADYGTSVALSLTSKVDKVTDNSKKSDAAARVMPKQDEQISDEELAKLLQEE